MCGYISCRRKMMCFKFKATVENQFDKKIKILRINNRREFHLEKFDQFYGMNCTASQKQRPIRLSRMGWQRGIINSTVIFKIVAMLYFYLFDLQGFRWNN